MTDNNKLMANGPPVKHPPASSVTTATMYIPSHPAPTDAAATSSGVATDAQHRSKAPDGMSPAHVDSFLLSSTSFLLSWSSSQVRGEDGQLTSWGIGGDFPTDRRSSSGSIAGVAFTEEPEETRQIDKDRGMQNTSCWRPSIGRRQSWDREERKHSLQMTGLQEKPCPGFSENK